MPRPTVDATPVDVLLPVRDGQEHLDAAIASMLKQTHSAVRVIVIDDGSTDASGELAAQWARKDARVKVVAIEPSGLPAALNAGLAHVEAPWIARMDADDISEPERIERLLAAAREDPEVVGWASWAHGMGADGRIVTLMARGPQDRAAFHRALERGPLDVNGATVLLRASAVRQVGGWDPTFDFAEDVELYDRLADLGPILTVPEPLYRVRIHAASHWAAGIDRSLTIAVFLTERRKARQHGRSLDFAEFVAEQQAAPLPVRVRRAVRVAARRWHHRATIHAMSGRRIRALCAAIPALILAPGFVVRRLRRLVSRRVARQTPETIR